MRVLGPKVCILDFAVNDLRLTLYARIIGHSTKPGKYWYLNILPLVPESGYAPATSSDEGFLFGSDAATLALLIFGRSNCSRDLIPAESTFVVMKTI